MRRALRYRLAEWRRITRSLVNYAAGYCYSPVPRYRCCGHITPNHYGWCKRR